MNQVMTAEDAASEGWQQTYDLLSDLVQHPININTATREQLDTIPFLSAQQVEEPDTLPVPLCTDAIDCRTAYDDTVDTCPARTAEPTAFIQVIANPNATYTTN